MASRGEARPDTAAGGVLGPAWSLRWRAPELALLLAERAGAVAKLAGDGPDRLKAEATVVVASCRLGQRLGVVERAIDAVRLAERTKDGATAAVLRVELAGCARTAGVPLVGAAVLRPVLTSDDVQAAVRADAFVQMAGCLAQLTGATVIDEALAEADRLYAADGELEPDSRVVLRALLRSEVSGEHRRRGDARAAVHAAQEGADLLSSLSKPSSDNGDAGAKVALRLVHGLLDLGWVDEATGVADAELARPVRAPAAAAIGWLALALAVRKHLAAGAAAPALGLIREAAELAERHRLSALRAEALTTLSDAHERVGQLAEALDCLRTAQGVRLRRARAVYAARTKLVSAFGETTSPEEFVRLLDSPGGLRTAGRAEEPGREQAAALLGRFGMRHPLAAAVTGAGAATPGATGSGGAAPNTDVTMVLVDLTTADRGIAAGGVGLIGEQVVSQVLDRVRDAAPVDAQVARVGGAEFAVLLPSTRAGQTERWVEHLRGAMATVDWASVTPGLAVNVRVAVAQQQSGRRAAQPVTASAASNSVALAGAPRVGSEPARTPAASATPAAATAAAAAAAESKIAAMGSAPTSATAMGSAVLGSASSGSAVSGSAALGSVSSVSGSAALGPVSGFAASGSAVSGPAALGPVVSGSAVSGFAASGSVVSGSDALGPVASGSAISGSAVSGSAAADSASVGSAASGGASADSEAMASASSVFELPTVPLLSVGSGRRSRSEQSAGSPDAQDALAMALEQWRQSRAGQSGASRRAASSVESSQSGMLPPERAGSGVEPPTNPRLRRVSGQDPAQAGLSPTGQGTGSFPAVHDTGSFSAARDTGSFAAASDTGSFLGTPGTGSLPAAGHAAGSAPTDHGAGGHDVAPAARETGLGFSQPSGQSQQPAAHAGQPLITDAPLPILPALPILPPLEPQHPVSSAVFQSPESTMARTPAIHDPADVLSSDPSVRISASDISAAFAKPGEPAEPAEAEPSEQVRRRHPDLDAPGLDMWMPGLPPSEPTMRWPIPPADDAYRSPFADSPFTDPIGNAAEPSRPRHAVDADAGSSVLSSLGITAGSGSGSGGRRRAKEDPPIEPERQPEPEPTPSRARTVSFDDFGHLEPLEPLDATPSTPEPQPEPAPEPKPDDPAFGDGTWVPLRYRRHELSAPPSPISSQPIPVPPPADPVEPIEPNRDAAAAQQAPQERERGATRTGGRRRRSVQLADLLTEALMAYQTAQDSNEAQQSTLEQDPSPPGPTSLPTPLAGTVGLDQAVGGEPGYPGPARHRGDTQFGDSRWHATRWDDDRP